MGNWKAVYDGTDWIVGRTDWAGRIIEIRGGYCDSKESAKLMSKQYNAGYC